MSKVYLNGEYLPLRDARVSVMDRGFLFGDGVYEVIPVYGGRLFRSRPHLARLDASLRAIHIDNPLSNEAWEALLEKLLEDGQEGDQSLYLQVTRGCAEKRDHAFPGRIEPTVFAMTSPIAPPDPLLAERGAAAVTLDDIRWQYCHIKAITLLPNVLLRQQAVEQDAMEAILVRDGLVTEGAASNLFLVLDGHLITPPKSAHLLPGITRDLVLELAARHDIPHQEADIPAEHLRQASELWVTSSTKEIVPITTLDGEPVGSGRPGPLYQEMHDYYRIYKEAFRRGEET